MNISGVALLKAYRSWLAENGGNRADASHDFGLVVLHDELEAQPGKLKVRKGGREVSDRGHKGVRSVIQSLAGAGLLKDSSSLVRIGVGIGRPVSREKDDVADFVLEQMTGKERAKIEEAVDPLISLLEEESRGN